PGRPRGLTRPGPGLYPIVGIDGGRKVSDMRAVEDTMTVHTNRRRFTVEQYHRMGRTGILGEGDRVELIEGDVVDLSLIKSRHAATVARLAHLFAARLRERAVVW